MAKTADRFGIKWLNNNTFRLQGYTFNYPSNMKDFLVQGTHLDPDTLYIAKTPELIRRYLALIKEQKPRNIVDIGIFRGGSPAFLQLAAKPERLLALEISQDRLDTLEQFIQAEGLEDTLRVAYGADQADTHLVHQITSEHFGDGRCLDVVFDDASHLLAPTRASFETLFPLIRPGGSFVIEDYASMHILTSKSLAPALKGSASARQALTAGLHAGLDTGQPLHQLAVEAMLASIAAPGVVKRVVADRHWLRIIRGHKDIADPTAFDLRRLAADHFGLVNSKPSNTLTNFL